MYRFLIALTGIFIFLTSCIEDGFTSSPSSQPTYSTDTLFIGDIFTGEGTPTSTFKVYNPNSKGIVIKNIRFRDSGTGDYFRVNVDGVSGVEFNDVEIRAKDSIFVLVEAHMPENGFDAPRVVNAPLDFVVNGVTSTVIINMSGRDVNRLAAVTIGRDTTFTSARPFLITDSLVVAAGATLTIGEGTILHFHDKASMTVHGTLVVDGLASAPVSFVGDRSGNVVGGIPYELMSGQWEGIRFSETSRNNSLRYLSMRNSMWGIELDSIPAGETALELLNCQLRNTKSRVLTSDYAPVVAVGCEFAEAPDGVVYLRGGDHHFVNCTFSNNYLFAAITGSLLTFDGDDLVATVDNSILYGIGGMISPSDIKGRPFVFRNCLLKPGGTNDDNFIDCLWDADPLFHTVREDYLFDYRLREGSPAIGIADAGLIPAYGRTDFFGMSRGDAPDLGAYVYAGPEKP